MTRSPRTPAPLSPPAPPAEAVSLKILSDLVAQEHSSKLLSAVWTAFSSPEALAISFVPVDPSKGIFYVDDKDIDIVLSQVKCSRERAESVLRKHRSDIVSAILELGEDDKYMEVDAAVGGGGQIVRTTEMEAKQPSSSVDQELFRVIDIAEVTATYSVVLPITCIL